MPVGPSFGERGEEVSCVEDGESMSSMSSLMCIRCKVGRAGFERLTEGGLSSPESSSFSDRWHLGEKSVPWR